MLIIGSQALAHHAKRLGVPFRTPTDLDVICSRREMQEFATRFNLNIRELGQHKWGCDNAEIFGHIEFELTENSVSGTLYHRYALANAQWCNVTRVYDMTVWAAPLEVLYSIKRSHRHYPRMWEKHILDYHRLKDMVGGVDTMAEITAIREKETEERYGKLKTPSLNQKTKDFFDDSVSNKYFIHDEMHAVMAHREKPMYEYIKVSPDKVACSKKKFLELDFDDRVRCVLEEGYVIALERAIVPNLFGGGPIATADSAIKWSLMRICTTLTSGWFRDFATENYPAIYKAHDRKYVTKFLQAVEQGRIKRVEKAA